MDTCGFVLVEEREIKEVSGIARLYKHDATGAEMVSVLNDDENKCFSVSFKTPVDEDTGVPHIIEHSVLCGSEKYKTKEPFVTLLKNSLKTFLNAMTFPDKTCYPVASTNLQDLKNLANVYLDAVFFPKLSEQTFAQEGWHFEVDENTGQLSYKGVVFNEMKGVYSSPDDLLEEKSLQSLFPSHPYSYNYGGDPKAIPNLTYAHFKEFHSKYYHPSNAFFFFWGDMPEEDRFKLLDPYLKRFSRGERAPSIPLMPYPNIHRQLEFPYASSEDETKSHITLNWLLSETYDLEASMVLSVLSHILMALPGSPLRKALIESELGQDLSGTGLDGNLRQAFFSIGLRSINASDAHRVEMLIMETLTSLVENGIDQRDIDAAMNTIEFAMRENNTGIYPRGLVAMLDMLPSWTNGANPLDTLCWEKYFNSLVKRLRSGEHVFEDAIQKYFLDHPFTTVLLLPDAEFEDKFLKEERAQISDSTKDMTDDDKKAIAIAAKSLHEAQLAPDSPEDLATIPSLTPSDLDKDTKAIPCEIEEIDGVRVLFHPLSTSGIIYVNILFPIDAVPEHLIPLMHLYARALLEIGTKKHNFIQLGTEIATNTGGMNLKLVVGLREKTKDTFSYLSIKSKVTLEKISRLFDLLKEVLLDESFDLRERFMLMLAEEAARAEQTFIPMGHTMIATRMSAHYSMAGSILEKLSGFENWEYLKTLFARIECDWYGILDDLQKIHQIVVSSNGMIISITSDATSIPAVREQIKSFVPKLQKNKNTPQIWNRLDLPKSEALIMPSHVNYVGLGTRIDNENYKWGGSISVIERQVQIDWLWSRIRVKGGAYGAGFKALRADSTAIFTSYRDPNIEQSLEAYMETATMLKNLRLDRTELDQLIVGAIGEKDAYMLPASKGEFDLIQRIRGITLEKRQKHRDECFATTMDDFHEFGEYLEQALKNPIICVLGGEDATAVAKSKGWTINEIL